MPLDGGISERGAAGGGSVSRGSAPAPNLQSGADIGQALKAVREHRGLSLDALAETTRVRASYLAAIEDMRLELLPSRPFTIGYIRAYASALGLDPDAAADRFRADEPVLDEPLREPLGLHDTRDPRFTSLVAGACVIVAAIFLWNIGRRAMVENAPPPPTASDLAAARVLAQAKRTAIAVAPPLPAPVESTTPPPYETPGLERALPREDGKGLTLNGIPKPLDQVGDPPPIAQLPAAFVAKGAVFGARPAEASGVVVQALKSASLIVRGADGSLYFARQLSPGEAFRAPRADGLTLNVTDPNAFQVFVGGQSRGVLPAAQASVSGLAGG
jgi:transcriptional regulator with XRE-family HTH domain